MLGLLWNKDQFTLRCDLPNVEVSKEQVVTKCSLLSAAHRVFDPIGFSCPVTLVPKMLLQESWVLKVGWDAPLPEEIMKPFTCWIGELPQLATLVIP